jgi:uncharacterized protein (DUF169 family)
MEKQFQTTASLLQCVLDLKRNIVAVLLVSTQEEYSKLILSELKRPLAFCMMVRLATLGKGRKATGKQFRCPGASFLFREPEPADQYGNRLFSFGLYKHKETAGDVLASMAVLPKPCYGVAVDSFAVCTFTPDTLFLAITPYQAMRLTQAWAYSYGPLQGMTLTGNRGVCSGSVAAPLAHDRVQISPLCSNTRYAAKWNEHELGAGIPFSRVDGVIASVNADMGNITPPFGLNLFIASGAF